MSATVNKRFSWSPSRHSMFQRCRRQYYFHYYASRDGGKPGAPARARELYILKHLTHAPGWVGRHVHEAIRFVLEHIRRGRRMPPLEDVLNETRSKMRQEFKDSRAGRYRENPLEFTGLFEHEYKVDLPDQYWKDHTDKAFECLKAFHSLPLFERLQALPPNALLALDNWVDLEVDKLPVKIRFDLVFQDGSVLNVVDWKTGSGREESDRFQAACYALCAHINRHAAPEAIHTQFIYLPSAATEEFPFSADDLEDTRAAMHDSADEMLFPLEDQDLDIPESEDSFDFADNPNICSTCNFLKMCPKWEHNFREVLS